MKIKKCNLVSFHYKENAIVIRKDIEQYLNNLEKYYNTFMNEHKKYYKEYLKQLDLMCQNWNEVMLDDELQWHFTANVYVLTTMGIIKNDEYNGLLFIYEGR